LVDLSNERDLAVAVPAPDGTIVLTLAKVHAVTAFAAGAGLTTGQSVLTKNTSMKLLAVKSSAFPVSLPTKVYCCSYTFYYVWPINVSAYYP